MLGGQFTDEATLASIRKDLGLDLSTGNRYLLYLNNVSPISFHSNNAHSPFAYKEDDFSGYYLHLGSFKVALKWPYLGKSYQNKRSVNEIIKEAFPGTMILAITSISLAILLGFVFGLSSAIYTGSVYDKLVTSLSAIGMSGPSFFTGILVAWLFGFMWFQEIHFSVYILVLVAFLILASKINEKYKNYFLFGSVACCVLAMAILPLNISFPGTGLPISGSLYDVHPFDGKVLSIQNLLLPTLTLAIRPLGVFVPLIRNAVLDEMSKPYIKTYRSWGYSKSFNVIYQAMPNALNPILTAVSGWFASLLAGAVFVEYIFSWRGLGLVMYEALERDDIPVVMGLVLLFASIFVLINAIVNSLYKYLDPRLR